MICRPFAANARGSESPLRLLEPQSGRGIIKWRRAAAGGGRRGGGGLRAAGCVVWLAPGCELSTLTFKARACSQLNGWQHCHISQMQPGNTGPTGACLRLPPRWSAAAGTLGPTWCQPQQVLSAGAVTWFASALFAGRCFDRHHPATCVHARAHDAGACRHVPCRHWSMPPQSMPPLGQPTPTPAQALMLTSNAERLGRLPAGQMHQALYLRLCD